MTTYATHMADEKTTARITTHVGYPILALHSEDGSIFDIHFRNAESDSLFDAIQQLGNLLDDMRERAAIQKVEALELSGDTRPFKVTADVGGVSGSTITVEARDEVDAEELAVAAWYYEGARTVRVTDVSLDIQQLLDDSEIEGVPA